MPLIQNGSLQVQQPNFVLTHRIRDQQGRCGRGGWRYCKAREMLRRNRQHTRQVLQSFCCWSADTCLPRDNPCAPDGQPLCVASTPALHDDLNNSTKLNVLWDMKQMGISSQVNQANIFLTVFVASVSSAHRPRRSINFLQTSLTRTPFSPVSYTTPFRAERCVE